MKKIVKKIVGKNYYLNNFASKVYVRLRRIYFKTINHNAKIDEKLVVFESYNGRNLSCSPKRVFELMAIDEKYKDFKLVVFVKQVEKYKDLYKYNNVKFVLYNSKEYYGYFAKAKYIFTNSRTQKFIKIKPEQIYVQCWHGTPLKRIGADIIENGISGKAKHKDITETYIHEANNSTYFVSPSKYTTEKLISSFSLEKLNKANCVLEVGYPRNDFLVNVTDVEIVNLKEKFKVDKTKKIILYAPTWRDFEHVEGKGYTYSLAFNLDNMFSELSGEYQILLRSHYFVTNSIDVQKYGDFIIDVSNVDDINELYVISDMLITDYSSVFFDFAILKRPIIFYMYDKDKYANEIRGFYLDLDKLPGNIVETEETLIQSIKNNTFDKSKYESFVEKFCYLEDGHAGERLIQKVIELE